MFMRWLAAIVILPGTVVLFVPLVILSLSGRLTEIHEFARPTSVQFWLAGLFLAAGASLGVWTCLLFFRFGNGTAAPWDPPRNFVVRGPYCHVRNPMILGVVLILIAEALLFRSWAIGIWAAIFFLGNSIYFPLFEEPQLRSRFGEEYRLYCNNVGRWVPRIGPWKPPESLHRGVQ